MQPQYPPPMPPQYAPQGYQQPVPQYAPPPQPAPPAAPPNGAFGGDPFHQPAPPGAGDPGPRPRDLLGCLVAYSPTEFTPAGAPGNTTGYQGDKPRDRVTADVIVLETPGGMPIQFGGTPDDRANPKPHYLQVAGPARFEGLWISNSNIVKALAPGGTPLRDQLLLGRVVESTVGRRPINLMACEPGTPDHQRAVQIYTALQTGQARYNDPQPIPGVPAPQPQAQQQAPQYAPPPMPPQYQQPAPPQQPWGDPAAAAIAAQFPGAQVVGGAPVPGLYPGAPAAPVAPPQAPALPPHLTAAGWTPEHWASLSPQQQAQVLSQTPTQ